MVAQRFVRALALPLLLTGMACGHAGEAPAPQTEVTVIKEDEGSSRSAFLGVVTRDLLPSVAKEKSLSTKTGALVDDVTDDSPAEKAGIAEGDVIIEFNGTAVDDAQDLIKAVRKAEPGSRATVVVVRGKEKKTLQATLGKRPSMRAFTVPAVPHVPAIPHIPRFDVRVLRGGSAQGLHLMDLNSQLREYFGAPEGKGVLVEKVDKRSAAKDAGFKAGDVILRIGREDAEDVEAIWDALKDVKGGDSAEVEILRKGSRLNLQLEVDDEEDLGSYYFRSRVHADTDKDLKTLKEEFQKQKQLKFHLEKDVKKLQEELRSMGKEIRSRMDMLRKTLNRELRQVIG